MDSQKVPTGYNGQFSLPVVFFSASYYCHLIALPNFNAIEHKDPIE